ncbi:MAG: 3-dehydroquinate synthase [Spirochaeta sp. LUC14_002_19_P3]|nr:MAG: 3-dehydroquinate synthase [Spirochaeta sp. LUC14_002_19_P3]
MKIIAEIPYNGSCSKIKLFPKKAIIPEEKVLLVFDSSTAQLFPDRNPEYSLVLPPGEAAKNWVSVERIISRALNLSLGRDGIIIGIGGGVVTDVTAFAASLYMRGCRLILVPTTLLAMVDAAAGGKTGIDFLGIKNLIGTFYPAEEVRICPELLKTLPTSEYRSGLAEVIKHAMLNPGKSGGLWDTVTGKRTEILARQGSILEKVIIDAVKVKVDIVSRDLKENGVRAYLNLGHTFGHALESATNFNRWSHGEAVAWGILKALELGERLSITDKQWADECRKLIADYGFEIITPQVTPAELKKAMTGDKKKLGGKLRFVLMRGLGEPILQEVPEKELDAVLKSKVR